MKDCPDCQIREVASRLLKGALFPYPNEVTIYEDAGDLKGFRIKPVQYIATNAQGNRLIVLVRK